jgi:hypothetical protein
MAQLPGPSRLPARKRPWLIPVIVFRTLGCLTLGVFLAWAISTHNKGTPATLPRLEIPNAHWHNCGYRWHFPDLEYWPHHKRQAMFDKCPNCGMLDTMDGFATVAPRPRQGGQQEKVKYYGAEDIRGIQVPLTEGEQPFH